MAIPSTACDERNPASRTPPLAIPESAPPSTAAAGVPAQARSTWRDPTAVLAAVEHLSPSTQPAEVFASLAEACAPAFSDLCWASLEDADATTRSRPNQDAPALHLGMHARTESSEDTLCLTFGRDTYEGWPAFSGTMAWRWHDRDRPTRSDQVIARLLLDQACALVSSAQLQALLADERRTTANLHTALESNREIGKAIGVLMWSYKLTSEQCFDLLRDVSQHTNRKIRDIAGDVCATGTLEALWAIPR
jgi:hypothetical protein